MNITILEKKESPLLKRREVSGEVSFEKATPSNKDLSESLAKQLNTSADLIIVKNIYTRFGQQKAKFLAMAYDNKDAQQFAEKLTSSQKKKLAESKKTEGAQ
jgi:small subunit ribosomal protein S24e